MKHSFTKTIVILILVAVVIAGVFVWYQSERGGEDAEFIACTADAKQCPDGSYVGRSGAACEYAACPEPGIAFNERVLLGSTMITPLQVTSDSRCPVDETCVWAGDFVVETKVEEPSYTQTRKLNLGDTIRTTDGIYVLDRVEPERRAGITISPDEYRLYFVQD